MLHLLKEVRQVILRSSLQKAPEESEDLHEDTGMELEEGKGQVG